MSEAHAPTASAVDARPSALGPIAAAAVAAAAVALHYDVVARLVEAWGKSPDYSHGYLVPVFSAFLLWRRREELLAAIAAPTPAWSVVAGINVFLLSAAMRSSGIIYQIELFQAVSILIALVAVALVMLGPAGTRIAAPAIGFLIFAIPLPGSITVPLRLLLQKVATIGSTYMLQTFGLPAVVQGNTIRLPDTVLGVAQACSGMRMLMTFAAIVSGLCLVSKQPLYEKALLLAAVIPITLAANIVRIVVTGLVHDGYGYEAGEAVHDWAGLGMVVVGVIFLSILTSILARLFPRDEGFPGETATPEAAAA